MYSPHDRNNNSKTIVEEVYRVFDWPNKSHHHGLLHHVLDYLDDMDHVLA